MSWGEIKKAINTDFSEPLNYLHWINDLATFGINSYVYNQPEKVSELINKSTNLIFNYTATDILFNGYADILLSKLTGDATNAFDGLKTMELVAGDTTAMTIVVNSASAMTAIVNSEVSSLAIRNSAVAITVLDNSLPLTVPIMTSDSTPSGLSVSSNNVVGFEAYRAFDGLPSTWWGLNGVPDGWIEYQFVNPTWLYKIDYQGRNGVDNWQNINSFKIQYFDGSNWADGFAGNFADNGDLQTISVASGVGRHNRWRLKSETLHVGTSPSAELQFYGK